MFELLMPFIAALAVGLAVVQIAGLTATAVRQRSRIDRYRNSQISDSISELRHTARAAIKNSTRRSFSHIKRELILAQSHLESNDVRTFRLADPTGDLLPGFQPGQHVQITAQLDEDSRVTRCYSLSSGPRSDYWQISVKRKYGRDQLSQTEPQTTSHSLSGWLHDRLQDGQTITVSHPGGNFVLDESTLVDASQMSDSVMPITLMAAGVGVTPIVSMLERIVERKSVNPVMVLYQVRDLQHAAFHERLLEINKLPNVMLKIYCSQLDASKRYPAPFYGGKIGNQTFEDSALFARGDAYMCGPMDWMSMQTTRLLEHGFSDSRIRMESFGAPERKTPRVEAEELETGAEPICNVEFAKSSTEMPVFDQSATVLELATAADVDIPSSCRSGNCGSCVVRLLRGQVENNVEPSCDLADDEIAACIAKPKGDISIHA